ncbi:MAG: molybdopterin-dependent oxidoreductase [Planctomycetaceae bacterium]|nr:molybdopterin-dependent oxidoreductase [Planctomycetaceae bacterium]
MLLRTNGKNTNPHQKNRYTGESIVGKPVPLVDAHKKSTGEAIYTDDIKIPDMLHARLLRATIAHGNIKNIDTSKARAIPGVRAVLTGHDWPVTFGVLPVSQDEQAIASDKSRFIGDIVAIVAADSEEIAAQAVWAINVEYEELTNHQVARLGTKPVKDQVQEKVDKGHPGTNVHKHVAQEYGEVDSGFKNAGAVAEGDFKNLACSHGFTEPHSTVCHWTADDRLTCYSAQQVPHYLHRAMAKVFGLPMHQIRIVKPMVGGGFGGKSDPFPHEIACALISKFTRKPVKLTFDREEVFLTNRGRHPSEMKMKIAADKKGKISAFESDVVLDGGAFGSFGVVTTYYNGVLSNGPYYLPAFRYKGRRVYSNHPASGAMRGHGSVNPRFAMETLMDMAAVELGVDPCELRLRNFLPEMCFTPYHKFRITSNGIREGLAEVMRLSDWKNKWGKLPYGRGIGVGCAFYISGSALPIHWNKLPQSTVHLKIDMDGGITVHSLAAEIGQGSDTVLAQMVAEVLGVNMDRIHVRSQETDLAPIDLGSYSSRVTFMAGNAARDAAEKIRHDLAQAAAKLTGQPAQYFDFKDERLVCRSKPSVAVTFMEALHEAQADRGALIASGCYQSPPLGTEFKGSNAGLSPSYSFSAYICEVDVDPETGFVQPRHIWAAHDCGRALNPMAVEGQLEGSIHMGLGQALTEQMRYRGGQLLNGNFLDYKIPTPYETPEMDIVIVESIDPEGPFGAKECGEGGLAPIIPAVGNAIYDAVGVRLFEVPMTPDRVLRAIEEKKRAGK